MESRWWVSKWEESVDGKSHIHYLPLWYLSHSLSLSPSLSLSLSLSLQLSHSHATVCRHQFNQLLLGVFLHIVQLCMKDVYFLNHPLHNFCRPPLLLLSNTPGCTSHTLTSLCVTASLSVNQPEWLHAAHNHILSLSAILSLMSSSDTLSHTLSLSRLQHSSTVSSQVYCSVFSIHWCQISILYECMHVLKSVSFWALQGSRISWKNKTYSQPFKL